jgi:hypothetical protein
MLAVVGRNSAGSLSNGDSGIASVDRPGLEVARGNGAKAEYGTLGDADSRRDGGAGADPRIAFDMHTVGDEREVGVVVVVGCAAEIAVLRENHVGVDLNRRGVVDLDAIACSDVVSADEIPGCPDFGGWVKVAIGSECGSEEPQQRRTPGMEWPRRETVQQEPAEIPSQPAKAVA